MYLRLSYPTYNLSVKARESFVYCLVLSAQLNENNGIKYIAVNGIRH